MNNSQVENICPMKNPRVISKETMKIQHLLDQLSCFSALNKSILSVHLIE